MNRREFNIIGIINVSMYQSLLAPENALENEEENQTAWDNFDAEKYKSKVLELTITELKKMIETLPEAWRVKYVEGSAYIYGCYMHNILDSLYFKVEHDGTTPDGLELTENDLQEYLTTFFLNDWESEFGATYRIYENLISNFMVEDFQKDKTESLKNCIVKEASRLYIEQADKGVADYSVYDSFYDATKKIENIPPEWFEDDNKEYDTMIKTIATNLVLTKET